MTTDFRPARWHDELPSVERLLSLSDNVIAFALTLLVLQVTVPPLSQVADPTSAADLAAQLAKQAPHLVSYVIAFYIIAQFWLATAGSSATWSATGTAWRGGTSRSWPPSRLCRLPAARRRCTSSF